MSREDLALIIKELTYAIYLIAPAKEAQAIREQIVKELKEELDYRRC